MKKEIVVTINGKGKLEFISIDENKIDKFVNKKAEEGYLVSVVTNGEIVKLASGCHIEFRIQEI